MKLENKNLGPNDITTEERNLIKDLQITKKDIEDFIINWAKYWENKDFASLISSSIPSAKIKR